MDSSVIASTGQGAGVGFAVGGPIGAAIGGGVGFISGLFSSNANKEAERLEQQKIEWAREAAVISNQARQAGIAANALATDLQRKQYAQRAYLATEGVRAGEVMSGLVGSSIARNARASVGTQLASNLQFSHATQVWGSIISDLQQEATDTALGLKEPGPLHIPVGTGSIGELMQVMQEGGHFSSANSGTTKPAPVKPVGNTVKKSNLSSTLFS